MIKKPSSVIEKTPGILLVIIAVFCFQFGAGFASHLFKMLGPGGTVFFRVGFSALILAIVNRGYPKHVNKKTLLWTCIFGIILAFMNFTFYSSFARLPLGVASTIEFDGPLVVAVLGSRKFVDFVCVAMAGLGILLFSPWTGASLDPAGVLFALIAATCWALYILLGAKVAKLLPGREGLTLAMGFGAIAMLPIGIVSAGTSLLNPIAIIAGLGVALLSSSIPYTLELEALRKMSTRVFSILVSLEPAAATIVGVLLLHQGLTLRNTSALLLVTVASILVTLTKKKDKTPIAEVE